MPETNAPRTFADRFRRVTSLLFGTYFLITLLGAAGFGLISPWISQAYFASSLATMVVYGIDKDRAGRGAWRLPESLLHLFELLGGWPGALFAQQLFRHKTRKGSYQAIFWLIVLLHLGAWTWAVMKGHISLPPAWRGR